MLQDDLQEIFGDEIVERHGTDLEGQCGNRKKFRILSISGGGTRGIIPSLVLVRLEQITGRHCTELFDLFIGTSTGAMISAVLTIPTDEENPTSPMNKWKYTAKDLLDVYIKEGPIVFESSMWKKVTTINGLYGPMYYTKNRDERFKVWMGETRLKDLLNEVMFTSYDMSTECPIFFKSRKARTDSKFDFLVSDCIKAATAAPTVWPPHLIDEHVEEEGLYMDALYGKNPSMFGLMEALRHHDCTTDDILLLSLGTGFSRKRSDPKNIITSGPGFLVDAFNSTINANTMSTMYMVRGLIKNPSRVLDIDIPLDKAHMGITDVSKEHINHLIKVTLEYLEEHEDELIGFAKQLLPESEWIKREVSMNTMAKNADTTTYTESTENTEEHRGTEETFEQTPPKNVLSDTSS